jgi:hypothetical protein
LATNSLLFDTLPASFYAVPPRISWAPAIGSFGASANLRSQEKAIAICVAPLQRLPIQQPPAPSSLSMAARLRVSAMIRALNVIKHLGVPCVRAAEALHPSAARHAKLSWQLLSTQTGRVRTIRRADGSPEPDVHMRNQICRRPMDLHLPSALSGFCVCFCGDCFVWGVAKPPLTLMVLKVS